MTLTIHHSNGNQTRYADDMAQATRMLKEDYGPDICLNDDWESHSPDSERMLVWASESDADNDDGSHAVAEIVRQNS